MNQTRRDVNGTEIVSGISSTLLHLQAPELAIRCEYNVTPSLGCALRRDLSAYLHITYLMIPRHPYQLNNYRYLISRHMFLGLRTATNASRIHADRIHAMQLA